MQTNVSRRDFLIVGAAIAGSLVAMGGSTAEPALAASLSHPGLLHTSADLARMRTMVDAGKAPWSIGYDRLVASSHSASSWIARPVETVVRGGSGQNFPVLYRDAHAAYQNALRWHVSGEEAHGEAAVRILNAWSQTMRSLTGNADRFLAAGIYGYQLANAAELVRDRPDFERERFSGLLTGVFAPMSLDFLTNHNGAKISNYWANWDLCNMTALIAIGGFAEHDDLADQALDYFENGAGNGSIMNAVPFVYVDEGLGQWQESGRDQPHSMMGIGLMAAFCEMAWNRGVDCYGFADNRFLLGAEYVAKYNLGHDVPFTDYTWQSGPASNAPHVGWNTQTEVSATGRAQERPVWELVLAHYSGRKGMGAPWVRAMAESIRPEGGGGDYGSTSGGYDQLGHGTLAAYLG